MGIKTGNQSVYKYLLLIAVMFIPFLSFFSTVKVTAVDNNRELRVGLIAEYKNRDSIDILNKNIEIGYSRNNKYKVIQSFSSNNGFRFTPFNAYYSMVNKIYPTYISALNSTSVFTTLSINACPVFIGPEEIRIMIYGSNYKEVDDGIKYVQSLALGYSFDNINSNTADCILVHGEKDKFIIDGRGTLAYPQFMSNVTNTAGVNCINLRERSYRGRVEIGRYGAAGLTVVNIIGLEEYLYGVVPAEMNPNWEKAALKAQAVCSRSYAMAKAKFTADSSLKKPYSLTDTVSDQVYKGYGAENSRTNAAVDETKNKNIRYKGKIIPAYYFSTSGGRTENIEDVWSVSVPYYRSVPDVYETEPERMPWLYEMSLSDIDKRLINSGYNTGGIIAINKYITTESNRVYMLKITGRKNTIYLTTAEIRSILELPSTKFDIITSSDKPSHIFVLSDEKKEKLNLQNCYTINAEGTIDRISSDTEQVILQGSDNRQNVSMVVPRDSSTVLFAGTGYGHGVGLSQSGAQGMAKAGFNYIEIIKYYFNDVDVY